jgi:thymidylate synthase (FAD)
MMQMKVLDHGYVTLIETLGTDERIIESARMSTGKGFKGWGVEETCSRCKGKKTYVVWGDSERDDADDPNRPCPACRGTGVRIETPGDEKLLRFLWENKHATPFEVCAATFEIQAPIFVFREWHRHRTQSYNERSARYEALPDMAFLPNAADSVARSEAASKNKQAGRVADAEVLTLGIADKLLDEERRLLELVEDLYQRKLKAGFPKELARTHLTVSRYSTMRATANLRNWLAFLTLRNAPSAQQEIRTYAAVIQEMLARQFPRTLALFAEGMKK